MRPISDALNRDHRVIVRFHRIGIDCGTGQQHVPFGPMNFEIAGLDGRLFQPAAESPAASQMRYWVTCEDLPLEPSEIICADENLIAFGSCERIDAALHHGVELFAAPCREGESPIRTGHPSRGDRRKMRFPVRRVEASIGKQYSAAPLHLIAFGVERLDPFI